jgi:DNA-binding transcriptional LysR family regulator
MVSEGLGCSIIPGELIPVARTAGIKVIALPGQPLAREIGILIRRSAMNRQPAQALIESLTAEAQAMRS